jgi:ATP-binding cassette subfamily B protein
LFFAGVAVTGIVASLVSNLILVKVSQGTQRKIRNALFNKMQSFPIKFFDTHKHGDIMSVYTNDVDTLEEMIGRSLPEAMTSIITIISILVAMIIQSPLLTVFVVVFSLLTIFVTKGFAQRSGKHFIGQQKSIGKVNGFIEEMLNGQKVIKVFTHEEQSKKEFDEVNEELFDNMNQANKYANLMMPVAHNMGNIQYVAIAAIGTLLALTGNLALTVGTLVAFLQLTRQFARPIDQSMMQINSIIRAMAGASRVFEMMDIEEEKDEGYVTLVNVKEVNGELVECEEKTGRWAWKHPHHNGVTELVELKGRIDVEDINFSYDGEKEVLHHISLYAKPGQKIAFVGATGAGKTTITNLINRFYEVDDGKIRYDGINITKIKKADLRKSLGVVLQDVNLFTGTIKDNIRYGRPDATDEEVIEAAKLANADSFIRHLPEGYDTMLTENGSQLSQGQRQLLSIARAAVADPPVMILDEATSSIDTRTEKIIQDGMDKLMEGRTVLVIAHRLSTVKNAKAIMVMANGEIIERGDHEQLIAQKGEYYQLYTGNLELE